MSRTSRGFTLAEMTVAAAIAAVVAVGTMSAFVMAARAHRAQGGPKQAEATALAQQLLEALRNRVAADEGTSASWISTKADGTTWYPGSDVVPWPAASSSETIIRQGAKRCYRLTKFQSDPACVANCDYYYQPDVRVCWNDTSNCLC